MKHLPHICAAVALTCVLAATSFAGEIGFPIASPPPPPATGIVDTPTTIASVEETALNLLQSVLLLF
jgi:NADH:ubiquinone oxidoreductase subunit F (NADH-binding)